jgi:hypothetical protein
MPEPVLFRSTAFSNRYLCEVLPDGAWADRPAFIVGGGPSLEGFDYKLLRGRRTIGINREYEFFNPTILFSMDTRFLNWALTGKYGEAARRRFDDFRGYRCWLLTYVASLRSDIFIVPALGNYQMAMHMFPMTSAEGIGHGNNSGYGALNLAVVLGADPIYLLGFDMKHSNGKTHHHGGHPVPQSPAHLENFKKHFNFAALVLKKEGRRVFNLNPDSALDCFPKMAPQEALS